MTKIMSPSENNPITNEQIGKILDLLTAGLRKSNIQSGPTQQIIKTQGKELVSEFVCSLLNRTEAISDFIVRRFVFRASDDDCVVEMFFFKLGHFVDDDKLEKEYELRGFIPAASNLLRLVNDAEPSLWNQHPNCTHWKDSKGKWRYIAFRSSTGERGSTGLCGEGWGSGWWFAGVSKDSMIALF